MNLLNLGDSRAPWRYKESSILALRRFALHVGLTCIVCLIFLSGRVTLEGNVATKPQKFVTFGNTFSALPLFRSKPVVSPIEVQQRFHTQSADFYCGGPALAARYR
jgi:hypothetical protein